MGYKSFTSITQRVENLEAKVLEIQNEVKELQDSVDKGLSDLSKFNKDTVEKLQIRDISFSDIRMLQNEIIKSNNRLESKLDKIFNEKLPYIKKRVSRKFAINYIVTIVLVAISVIGAVIYLTNGGLCYK